MNQPPGHHGGNFADMYKREATPKRRFAGVAEVEGALEGQRTMPSLPEIQGTFPANQGTPSRDPGQLFRLTLRLG